MRRRFLKQAAALSASMAAAPLAFGQADWPTRPIKLLVPYPPGGATDPIARALGQGLQGLLGQPVVVENRPGAGTAIAAGAVAKGEADGYTLLFTTPITHVMHTMQAPRGYDALKDFAPISAVSRGDFVLVVHPSVPANTLQEFIAYGRANPDKISAGLFSVGGADHLATELFKLTSGIKLTAVPYKGAAAAMSDLLTGRLQMFIIAHSIVRQHIESGKLRMLAYAVQPVDKPPAATFAQAGLPGFDPFVTMNIILAPAATPAPVVAKLSAAIQRTLETPETRNAILGAHQSPYSMAPAALRDKLAGDHVKFSEIVQKAGIKFD